LKEVCSRIIREVPHSAKALRVPKKSFVNLPGLVDKFLETQAYF